MGVVPDLSIVLVGDVLPTRPLLEDRAAAAGLRELAGLLSDADVAVGNFEMPLTRHGSPRDKLLTIRADPELAGDVAEIGLDVVTVANNHSLDYGWGALRETIDALRATGLVVVGAGANLAEAAAPAVLERGGRRIGVLAFSCLLPPGAAAGPEHPGLSPVGVDVSYEVDAAYQMEEPGDPGAVRVRTSVRADALDFARACVQRCRRDVDTLICTVHWGYGSGDLLAEYQRPLGHALVEAGADIVHGHHVHAIQGIEFHQGRPILYSAGTFIGQQTLLQASADVRALWAAMSPDGYVAQTGIGPDGAVSLRVIPTTLNDSRLPEPVAGERFVHIAERLQRLSAAFGTSITQAGDQLMVNPHREAVAPAR
jgi:poly-gamma-glutamate synthesis protein (capsule biosynthesis protein)